MFSTFVPAADIRRRQCHGISVVGKQLKQSITRPARLQSPFVREGDSRDDSTVSHPPPVGDSLNGLAGGRYLSVCGRRRPTPQ